MDGENRSLRAIVDKITTTARDDLPESERDSLLKMVFGMAVAAYQYDPEKKTGIQPQVKIENRSQPISQGSA